MHIFYKINVQKLAFYKIGIYSIFANLLAVHFWSYFNDIFLILKYFLTKTKMIDYNYFIKNKNQIFSIYWIKKFILLLYLHKSCVFYSSRTGESFQNILIFFIFTSKV